MFEGKKNRDIFVPRSQKKVEYISGGRGQRGKSIGFLKVCIKYNVTAA